MTDEALERYYQESLEERLISELARVKKIPLEQAMDIYYNSELAQRIHEGKEGVQYLDYRVLVQMLLEQDEL